MARIRTIKPEFWEDEKLADIPLQARLLFIGTWNFADDFGVLIASAKFLKSKVFPYDESLREHQVVTWLDALVNARMLVPFVYENKSYYKIRTFDSHQLIDKRYTKSILPEGVSASELLAGLDLQQNTTLSHSEHHVFTRSNSKSKGSVKEEEEEVYRKFAHLRISVSEFEILKIEYGEQPANRILDQIENYRHNTKYKSLYKTAKNWLEKDKEKSSAQKESSKFETLTNANRKAHEQINALFANGPNSD